MAVEHDIQDWCRRVERLLIDTYALDLNDVGYSSDELASHFSTQPDAAEFVSWFGMKYDLTTRAEIGLGRDSG